MTTMETVEPGIYRRVDPRTGKVLPKLWIHYPRVGGGTEREPAHTTSLVTARKLRARRMEAAGRGEPGRAAEKVTVNALLDGLIVDYETNGRRSLASLRSSLAAIRPVLGPLRVAACTTDRIQRLQRAWQQAGTSNATINRRGDSLRRAFVLGARAGLVARVPWVPEFEAHSPRGRFLPPADAAALAAHLAPPLRPFFAFAYDHGTRKGQLARTLRRFVDFERGVIVWPPEECKHGEAHTLPLEGEGLAIVQRLMARPPLHCPYLFHGPRCAPGRRPSKDYACVGSLKYAWRRACRNAGLPVGRAAGGFVFHHTRNTAVTTLTAGGMAEADVMKVTGHQTAHVFKRYDLGNVEALRARLAQARTTAATLTPLRRSGDTPAQRVAEPPR